tara:strand:- start:692 stop:1882 length:1191 start_codon:yes stop_codon:yes gene_type:complete
MPLPDTPFLLIDDARTPGARPARLYRDPVAIVRAQESAEVKPALAALKTARARGLHAAGFIGYEAGYALEPRLAGLATRRGEGDPPLLWFGLFEEYTEIVADAVPALLTGSARDTETLPAPLISRSDYEAGFAAIAENIVAGDIYQANFTFPCRVEVGDDPAAFYGTIRPHAAAGYGALVYTGAHWLLSFSPEQFFALEGDVLNTRPMKGTALRDADPARDAAHAEALRNDPKQRAENLMIVDLLRNDLSRIAVPGSVAVPDLFTIESYPTVHQMTSRVTARLRPGLDAVDAFAALFPCGSITGAPKIRAMEIIHTVETYARGPYTGAVGAFDSNGNAAFNVAIRTICVKDGAKQGVIGLGSGLVADSMAASEWNECLDKGRFLGAGTAGRTNEQS